MTDSFSASIENSHFDKENNFMAQNALKQLWEECCAEADNLGRVEGVQKLEHHLKLFLGACNRTNASLTNSAINSLSNKAPSINQFGRNIPMTHGKYSGSAKRLFNTHHM